MKNSGKSIWAALVVAVCLGLAACGIASQTVTLSLVGYNHTDSGIGYYKVQVENGEGASAGFLDAGAGGGGKTCCLSLPKWHAGLKVKVTSQRTVGKELLLVEEVVPVPQWDPKKASRFNVHFLRTGKVKVFVTSSELSSDDYPLKGEEAVLQRKSYQ